MSIARIGVFAAVCAAAALLACISAELADAQSSVAAAAVHKCSIITASHRNQGRRALSSAQVKRGNRLCSQARTYINGIQYWQNSKRRWTLYPNQNDKKCWQVRLRGPLSRCLAARGAVRRNTTQLVRINHRLTKLLPKPHLVHDTLYQLFLCIHTGRIGDLVLTHGEGSWTANTGNGYYGGLQMDPSFQHSYGADFVARWGTADNWPAWAQMTAGERAYRSGRGVGPWPVTGPPCAAHLQSQLVQL